MFVPHAVCYLYSEQNMFMDDEGMFIIFTMLHDYYYSLSYGEFELS